MAPKDTSAVRVTKERPAAKKQRISWWTEENLPRLNKSLVNSRYPAVRGKCDEACLELGLDTVPKQKVFNVLQRIDREPIAYENELPMNKRAFISERQVKYVEDIIVKRDTANLGMSRMEVIWFAENVLNRVPRVLY